MSLDQLVLALLLGALIVVALFLVWPPQRSRTHAPPAERSTGVVYRDDERYWLGGIIYNNPDDPDLIVPKRFGYGRTLNIGQPLGKLIIIGPLLLPVVLGLLSLLFPGSITSYGCHPSGCRLWP
jgi:uncharacterized membrane protein